MNTLERLKSYFDNRGIATGTAEKACGFGNATLRNAFDGGKGIGTDKLEKILSVYPDLSSEWLLRGTGTMLIDIGLNETKDDKFKEFQDKVFRMSRNKEQMNMAYDIALSALDIVSKTYDFFSKK